MNPFRWKREHQIALLGAALIGACIGLFAGARQLDPGADFHGLKLGLWGLAGFALGGVGGFIRQVSRH